MPTSLLWRLWLCIFAVCDVEVGAAPYADGEDAKSVLECMCLKTDLLVEVKSHASMYRSLGNVDSFDAALSKANCDMTWGLEECVRGYRYHIQDPDFEYSDAGSSVMYVNQFVQDWLPAITGRVRAVAQAAVSAAGFQLSQLGMCCMELLRQVGADSSPDVDGEPTYPLVSILSEWWSLPDPRWAPW
mmetsp:Transcript_62372/g.182225  ORF Transcript_62372/g.182225 Transcript_62372/m.182225 type:complete len:187 (+) Transcript_62372:46-606(+)